MVVLSEEQITALEVETVRHLERSEGTLEGHAVEGDSHIVKKRIVDGYVLKMQVFQLRSRAVFHEVRTTGYNSIHRISDRQVEGRTFYACAGELTDLYAVERAGSNLRSVHVERQAEGVVHVIQYRTVNNQFVNRLSVICVQESIYLFCIVRITDNNCRCRSRSGIRYLDIAVVVVLAAGHLTFCVCDIIGHIGLIVVHFYRHALFVRISENGTYCHLCPLGSRLRCELTGSSIDTKFDINGLVADGSLSNQQTGSTFIGRGRSTVVPTEIPFNGHIGTCIKQVSLISREDRSQDYVVSRREGVTDSISVHTVRPTGQGVTLFVHGLVHRHGDVLADCNVHSCRNSTICFT